jgi:hypothetical protein
LSRSQSGHELRHVLPTGGSKTWTKSVKEHDILKYVTCRIIGYTDKFYRTL